jgi:hypothetical protein
LFGTTSPHGKQPLPHDLGGSPDFLGPIPVETTGDLQVWERECHALVTVLASKGVFNTDQLRRTIEDLTPQQYASWSYYGRWGAAVATLLLDQGLISDSDLRNALFGETSGGRSSEQASLFEAGDMVRVKSFQHGVEWRRPHIRVPGYIYGVKGRIVDVCGKFGDPSFLSFGIEAPKIWLYRVVSLKFSSKFLPKDIVRLIIFVRYNDLLALFFRFLGNLYERFVARTKHYKGHDKHRNLRALVRGIRFGCGPRLSRHELVEPR